MITRYLTLIAILITLSNSIFSQEIKLDSIVYDVLEGKFTDNIKQVSNKTNGFIYLRHYNPFVHNKKVSVNNINSNDKVFSFISGIVGTYFGLKIPLEIKSDLSLLDIRNTTEIDNFTKLYNKYLELLTEVRQNYLDCSKITLILNEIDSMNPNDIVINLPNELKNSSEFQSKYNLKNNELRDLVLLKKNVAKFLDNNSCLTKVAKYTADGNYLKINIKLTAREESKLFGFPIEDIEAGKTITIKKSIPITFSSGIMGSKNVVPDYFIAKETDGFYIRTEDKGTFMPGAFVLSHFHIFGKHPNFSLNLGAGATIEGTPHLLAGISQKIFDSKLLLNIGYGLAYRTELSDNLSLDTKYNESPVLKTKKDLFSGFWFGLSYQIK